MQISSKESRQTFNIMFSRLRCDCRHQKSGKKFISASIVRKFFKKFAKMTSKSFLHICWVWLHCSVVGPEQRLINLTPHWLHLSPVHH